MKTIVGVTLTAMIAYGCMNKAQADTLEPYFSFTGLEFIASSYTVSDPNNILGLVFFKDTSLDGDIETSYRFETGESSQNAVIRLQHTTGHDYYYSVSSMLPAYKEDFDVNPNGSIDLHGHLDGVFISPSEYPNYSIDYTFSGKFLDHRTVINDYSDIVDQRFILSNLSSGLLTFEVNSPQGHARIDITQFSEIYAESLLYSKRPVESPSPVPLPSSAPLFGAALLGLCAVGYGLKRKDAAV